MASSVKCQKCPMCPYMTTLNFRMKSHKMAHSLSKERELFNCDNPISSFRCCKCVDFETDKLVSLKQHFEAGHAHPESVQKEKLRRCGSCDFETHSEYLYSIHMALNLCEVERKIKLEEAVSEGTEKLKKDQEKKLHNCRQCSYVAKTASFLKSHVLFKHTDHDKIQWFQCEQCSYKSKAKSDLKKHKECMHDKTKPKRIRKKNKSKLHKCEHCQYTTNDKHRLKIHVMNKHTDPDKIQWLQCEQCSYKSKTKIGLKKHTLNVHSDKKLKCEHCQYQTKSKYSLRDHILVKHTDPDKVQWFKCEHCSYKTTKKFYLKKHVNSNFSSTQ